MLESSCWLFLSADCLHVANHLASLVLAANGRLLLPVERHETPTMPPPSGLVLRIGPKSNQQTHIRLMEGVIEHYDDRDLETWS